MSRSEDKVGALVVARIGREGDGVVEQAEGPLFIPDALPGESFTDQGDGRFVRVGPASPQRVEAACRHFGTCGGCVAQHMSAGLYRDWKEGLIRSAFGMQGLDIELRPLVVVGARSRRRAQLTAVVDKGDVRLGFHERRSHAIVPLAECPVMDDAIVAALPLMREIVLQIPVGARSTRGQFRAEVSSLANGLDVAIAGGGASLSAPATARLAALALRGGFARLSLDGVVVFAERRPVLKTAGGDVSPPPGAFFQAVFAAEQAMAGLVLEGVGNAKAVADLFAGVGTFTLSLAHRARVLAVDSSRSALDALAAAARQTKGLKPIETRLRNLIAEPLASLELAGLDAVVVDPPRAGAKAQVEMLAKSKVGRVVMVSCNPGTLARDCRILVDGGFSMGPVHGIDQFLWSAHAEAVVVLTRGR